MACRVVCISHTTGAGGEEVGRLVAERLGFLYVDDEIVARAAAKGGLGPDELADEERRKSLVARVLEALAQGSGDALALGAVGMPPSDRSWTAKTSALRSRRRSSRPLLAGAW